MSSSPVQSEAVASPTDHSQFLVEQWECWEAMTRNYGSPCYVYDAETIEKRATELLSVLSPAPQRRLFYSFKANPLPSVAQELKSLGCEAELTSVGEIGAARAAGCDLGRALYGGPGKGVSEYRHAIQSGLIHFSVESPLSLRNLSTAAETEGRTVEALLRMNPDSPPKAKLAMSGVASQFGFEEDELLTRGQTIREAAGKFVTLTGLHLYWGTQIDDTETLLNCFEKTASLAVQVAESVGFPLRVINFGGGFAWPYAHSGSGSGLQALRAGLELLSGASDLQNVEWWFESGRYLVASSGTLLTRVMELKESKGRLFLLLDTGIHHLGGMSGLGRIPRFSVDLLTAPRNSNDVAKIVVDVVGQLCTPLDCIAKRIEIPRVGPGDLLAIPNVGAYGATASVGAFLSRPAPAEIVYRGEQVLAVHRLRTGHEEWTNLS